MIPTIEWIDDRKCLRMVDQLLLPMKLEYLEFTNFKDVANSIKIMNVRGAPAIGVTAAMGMACAAIEFSKKSKDRKDG